MVGDQLVWDVVRGLSFRVWTEGRCLRFGPVDQHVSILNARMELEAPAADGAAQLFVDGGHESGAIRIMDVTRGEVVHSAFADRDQIAADRPVGRTELEAHRHRLEWGPAGVDGERIVAKQTEGGDVARRGQR